MDSNTVKAMPRSFDATGGHSAGTVLLGLRWVRGFRQTGSDWGSSKDLPTLGKVQPDEATSTSGTHSTEEHDSSLNAMVVRSTACGRAAEHTVPIRPLHAGLAGSIGSPDEDRLALEEQHPQCMAGASCGEWPQEGVWGASSSLCGRSQQSSHDPTPQSQVAADGPPGSYFRHRDQASDLSPYSLQHNSPFQEEHASPPSMGVHGHGAHECCQHESHQPDAHIESGMRSASAAACRGRSSEGQRTYCSERARMNDIAHTPGSSSSSLSNIIIMAAEHGAPARVRSRSSMVFELA